MAKIESSSLMIYNPHNQSYLLQVRNVFVPKFNPGEYPFVWPGALSLFGGGIEIGETPEQAVKRELGEEFPGAMEDIQVKLEYRKYDWDTKMEEVMERVNKTFHGNLLSFLGFNPDEIIPSCAEGRWRTNKDTYKKFLGRREEHFYVGDVSLDEKKYNVQEGSKALWVPHEVARACVLYPGDKLAVLDDLAMRVERREITLE